VSIHAPADRLSGEGDDPWTPVPEATMKFVCLGYLDETRWEALSEGERAALMEDCFAFDDELRRRGHFVGGEALQSVRNAVTLRHRDGRVTVTDGPYAETKEHLGGILLLEARDLNHAIQLMSGHPGVCIGPFEIRAADEWIHGAIAARRPSASAATAGSDTSAPRSRPQPAAG
jgi:hypothetical protein